MFQQRPRRDAPNTSTRIVRMYTSLTRLLFREQEEVEARLGMAIVGDDTQLVLVEYLGLMAGRQRQE